MLTRQSRVSTQFLEKCLDILLWYCISHHISVIFGWSIKRYRSSKSLKSFLNWLYICWHIKNHRRDKLDIEIMKIGRIFGSQWASTTDSRAAETDYYIKPVNLCKLKLGNGRSWTFRKWTFLSDLVLVHSIPSEMSILSLALFFTKLKWIK